MDLNEVLIFWFGSNPELITNQELWFRISSKTDKLITEKFSSLLSSIERLEPSQYPTGEKDLLAILIVLHQFTRFINRGQASMFNNDPKAIGVANTLLGSENIADILSPIERYFVFLVLLESEDLEEAQLGLKGVESLFNSAEQPLKGKNENKHIILSHVLVK